MTRSQHCTFSILLLLFVLTGCTQITKQVQTVNDTLPWNAEAAAMRVQDSAPVRIAAVWSHDVISIPGQNPVQGFGGRLYFYNHEQKPLEVEGKLVVFAFDDTGSKLDHIPNRQPDRKFVFRATELDTHFSESQLGPSYSFWIPWQELGGEHKLISLVPVFVPTDGLSITGHFSRTSLPGRVIEEEAPHQKDPLANADAVGRPFANSTISTRADNRGSSPRTTQVRTTTFDLPQNLTRQLTSSPNNPPQRANWQNAVPTNSSPVDSIRPPPATARMAPAYQTLQSSSGVTAIKVIKPVFPTRSSFATPPPMTRPNDTSGNL